MPGEKPQVRLTSPFEQDPSYTDPAEITKSREELLAMDTEGKLIIAPNQENKGDLDMWKLQLFEPREELDGQTPYDFFDKIIFGHGEGSADTNKRTFQGAEQLGQNFQGTIREVKQRSTQPSEKVLVVVCGTSQEDKMTLTKAIKIYFENENIKEAA